MAEKGYGQFCPISKAMELLGEKWTLLIVRELLMGGSRFNEMQRGLTHISPTLLTKRLVALEDAGLLIKRKIPGQRGHEYFPTSACEELLPVIEQIGQWGMRWARHSMREDDFDVQLLRDWIRPQYDVRQLTGKVASGGHILDSIMDDKCPCTPEQLRRDRRDCCQKGDAWPKRPTLIPPFGVVDAEMAINFPGEAEFPYPPIEYRPTEDEFVVKGMTAFHAWSDQR